MNLTSSRGSLGESSLEPDSGVRPTAPIQSVGCDMQAPLRGCSSAPYTTAEHTAVLKLENKNMHTTRTAEYTLLKETKIKMKTQECSEWIIVVMNLCLEGLVEGKDPASPSDHMTQSGPPCLTRHRHKGGQALCLTP